MIYSDLIIDDNYAKVRATVDVLYETIDGRNVQLVRINDKALGVQSTAHTYDAAYDAFVGYLRKLSKDQGRKISRDRRQEIRTKR